jgi:hypothetical protein
MAAKAATATIPIVFVVGLDPVAAGLVLNLNNPGGNATGMTLISHVLGPKRLELVRDIFPKASSIAMLVNPLSPDTLAEVYRCKVLPTCCDWTLPCSTLALTTKYKLPCRERTGKDNSRHGCRRNRQPARRTHLQRIGHHASVPGDGNTRTS